MLRYIMTRVLLFIPLLFGLSVAVFIYLHLIPGDPISAMYGQRSTPELIAQVTHEFGLDRPLLDQYLSWLNGLLHGDLGISFRSRLPLTPLFLQRIPATLELAVGSLLIGLLIGLPTGIIAGMYKNTWIDYLSTLLALAGLSMPTFWLGTILVLVFSVNLHILPSQGYTPLYTNVGRNLTFILMPAVTLGLAIAPYIARMTRTAVVETLQEPFVNFARAKGLRNKTIFLRYVWRHAFVSIIVVLGLNIGLLLSGQIVVEELFNWPGAGRLIIRGVLDRDYFVIMGAIMVYATMYLTINLLVEVLHSWLDPRVRY